MFQPSSVEGKRTIYGCSRSSSRRRRGTNLALASAMKRTKLAECRTVIDSILSLTVQLKEGTIDGDLAHHARLVRLFGFGSGTPYKSFGLFCIFSDSVCPKSTWVHRT